MKRILSVFFFISLFHLSLLAESIGKLNALRCEYLVAPLGIDVPSPRLSWQLPVDVDVQEAYQVIVGTDSVRVAQGMGDSWNSGKQTISNVLAVYAGQKLQPYTRYYWKVCAWDSNKMYTSDVTYFETGVMDEHNWKGNWISDTHNIHLKPAAYFRKNGMQNVLFGKPVHTLLLPDYMNFILMAHALETIVWTLHILALIDVPYI